MNKNWILAILLFTVGSVSLLAFFSKNTDTIPQDNAEKINLALRQTAHLLLKQAGDSTSRIPPIKNTQENIYLVRLESHFNYDSLPIFLHRSFKAHEIESKYDVSVWDCEQKELILGYSSFNFLEENEVPCGGRNMANGCYNFIVTFTDSNANSHIHFPLLKILLSILAISVLGFLAYIFYRNKGKKALIEGIPNDETLIISIGNSIFNTQNETIKTGNLQQSLTYREAKLLQLFCQHKNELLDRDFILKVVWEDEGILVGRSLDVFVSRLRKLLKHDETLKITNVHGRGYKFEVLEQA